MRIQSTGSDRLVLAVLSITFLAVPAAAQNGLAPAERARATYGSLAPSLFTGEVVVKSDLNFVVIAVDKVGAEGRGDGQVDHVFVYSTPEPVLSPISFTDPDAEIELRPTGLCVFAHTEQAEIELLINGVPPSPRAKASPYSYRVFQYGVQLLRYSGPVVESLSLAEVERRGGEGLLASLRAAGKQITPQSPEKPSGDGGTCQPSCNKSCPAGACSAACNPGHCATCKCLLDDYPSCFCA